MPHNTRRASERNAKPAILQKKTLQMQKQQQNLQDDLDIQILTGSERISRRKASPQTR